MRRQLVRLADGSGFNLAGERLDIGAMLELQIERDHWLPGRIHWSANTGAAVGFIVKLGGPHERHAAPAPEIQLRLDPSDAWFRFPAAYGN
jgi:hypothetical protein